MRAIKPLVRPLNRRYRKLRRNYRMRKQRNTWHRQIAAQQSSGELVRVIVGSGPQTWPGWIVTDLPYLDVINPVHWKQIMGRYQADRLLAEHVMEHLTPAQFVEFLQIVRSYVAPNGFIRIAVPDGNHPDPNYIEYVRPGGIGPGAADHKVIYSHKTLTDLLAHAGYTWRLLEYFDQDGQFHCQPWDVADGMIQRSADHDYRNREKPLSYTSLIVDFWPARPERLYNLPRRRARFT